MIPLYLQNLPEGIEIRGKSIRLRFSYQGKQRNETLKGKEISKANIEFAKRKLALIKLEIADGVFNYGAHFPHSKQAQQFRRRDANRTVKDGGEKFLARKKAKLSPSAYRTYESKFRNHTIPQWGDVPIREISKSDLEDWQIVELQGQGLSERTINMIFTVLRGVFDDAFSDEIINSNPMDRITNLEVPDDLDPDPFTQDELDKLLSLKTDCQQEINAYGANARTGLRESELMGLAWEDINTVTWQAHIQRGLVRAESGSEYRVTKTKNSDRVIDLQPEAIVFFKKQMKHTYALPSEDIEIRQRNSQKTKIESLNLVFRCTATGKPWTGDTVFRKTFSRLLRKAGLRYRGPNQLRHTFCCWLLTNSIPPEWIAPVMGTSVAMIKKHYGKVIEGDRPDMGKLITKVLQEQKGLEIRPELDHPEEGKTQAIELK